MNTFRDKMGREWTVVVDGYVLHRARSHGNINLAAVFAGLEKAVNAGEGGFTVDPSVLLDLCYYGCEHNARIQAKKVDKQDFLRMLTGKTLADALAATASALGQCFAPPDEATPEKEGGHPLEQAVLPEG